VVNFRSPSYPVQTRAIVYTDDADADGRAGAAAEVSHLLDQVSDDAIDLLDHGLGEDVHFHTDFDGGELAAADLEIGLIDGGSAGYELTEGGISSPRGDPATAILDIKDAFFCFDASAVRGRSGDGVEVVVEMDGHEIASAGIVSVLTLFGSELLTFDVSVASHPARIAGQPTAAAPR